MAGEPDSTSYELADDGGVIDRLTRDKLYFLDMVFAANINDKDEHCQLADREGCDLWMAELSRLTRDEVQTSVGPAVLEVSSTVYFRYIHQ